MHAHDNIVHFGETDYRNKRVKFGIKPEDRTRHVYIIGKTGMGKSTLLENMAVQDIQNGNGLAFIDPHGGTAELFLDYIPKERIDDVLYFAPFDMDYPVSFNVMEDVGAERRHLVASGLMSAFKKIWVDAWSARMEYILNNTILALLEFPDSTLISINRMFVDKDYRNTVVANVTDPGVRSFWNDEFANYTERFAAEATPAIQNKIGQFVSNPVIRNIIGQPKSSFDMRKLMDDKKIFIVNLSKGRIGEDNANLLGSMLVTKIYLGAMSRAEVSRPQLEKLPNFYLFVDEFQSFANESFADILSEARKYKLNLTIAHQYMAQMVDEVRDAVIGNVGTMISFRIGSSDAEILEKEFAPQFTMEDFVNLGKHQVYLKLMIDGVSSAPFSARTLPPIQLPSVSYKDVVIARSREQYAAPRAHVEQGIKEWHEESFGDEKGGNKTQKSGQSHGGQHKKNTQNKGSSGSSKSANKSQGGGSKKNLQKKSAGAPPGGLSLSDAIKQAQEKKAQKAETQETELRKAMSLDHLKEATRKEAQKKKSQKKQKQKEKGPSQEHLQELKGALASVLKETTHQEEVSPDTNSKYQTPNNKQTPNTKLQKQSSTTHAKPTSTNTPEQSTPPEVPEDVLKKLLEMESREHGEK